jgi:hypothetical protein
LSSAWCWITFATARFTTFNIASEADKLGKRKLSNGESPTHKRTMVVSTSCPGLPFPRPQLHDASNHAACEQRAHSHLHASDPLAQAQHD